VGRYSGFIRWLLLQQISRLMLRYRGSRKPGNILVVHPCRIGDMVLWLDAARGLRELYPAPTNRIVLLASTDVASLVRTQPYFDCVWEIDRERFSRSPRYRWRLLRRIAEEGFSLALNPAGWQDYYVADSIIGASGAGERVGWSRRLDPQAAGDRLMRWWRARNYTRLLLREVESGHSLQLNAKMLHALGHRDFVAHAPKLILERTRDAATDSTPSYVISPGAANPMRRWPLERFAEVAKSIFAATGMHGVICGSIDQKPLAKRICELVDAPLADLAGSQSLEEFARCAADAKLVIANDSGAVHLAAAAGARTLCVLAGGHFGWALPYDSSACEGRHFPRAIWHQMECFGCNWRCRYELSPQGAPPCLTDVATEYVIAAALAMLA
jgi:ADP-heptose:LPS heptosyltransferase